MNLVYFLIHKYFPTVKWDEDITQAGMVGLCRAADKYDETKSSFSAFASVCIMNSIKMELNMRKKSKNQLSLDYDVVDEDNNVTSFGDYLVGENDVEYVNVDGFYEKLTPKQKEIFNFRQSGIHVTKLAKMYGCSRETIYKEVRKMKALWRETNGD